ncbi:MAG: ribbon-helix-helix protein, CopG family [Clostridiales bacterium]|nr:ribbon-helix-helix protein, CopG family [Clostridiales bacterium]
MSIASDKTRVSIVIDKEDKLKLEELAQADDRSLNYVINKAIKEYLENIPNQ